MQHEWNAQSYETHGRFVADHGSIIVNWLNPRPSEFILDAGCGDGALTEKIAQSGALVEGVEVSPSMADAAKARGLSVREMDLLALADEDRYDAIISNAVLHWIEDWPQLLKGFHKALKKDGRLVVECGGHGNIAAIRTAICAAASQNKVPTFAAAEAYHTPEDATALLNEAGFEVEKIELAARRTFLQSGMSGWLSVFRHQFIEQFAAGAPRDEVMELLLRWLEPQLKTPSGEWFADYVRLRFIAHVR